ncbi:AAEL009115-PA [Aedes aegypti]|uniref:AAEL009115-PA n=1 Tax=Aedes aegypti TaxID=7159 RepID=Q16WS7_AEDAE|nr:AAEL009115-PA [Aedes aegypti]
MATIMLLTKVSRHQRRLAAASICVANQNKLNISSRGCNSTGAVHPNITCRAKLTTAERNPPLLIDPAQSSQKTPLANTSNIYLM